MAQHYIKKEILDAVGIVLPKLPVDEETAFIEHLNDTLRQRIGGEISASLGDEELDAMLEIEASGDDAKLQAWLKQNVPELNQIVQDEIDIMLGELAENADAVVTASKQQPLTDDKDLAAVEDNLVEIATSE
jgi:hypothetical protein